MSEEPLELITWLLDKDGNDLMTIQLYRTTPHGELSLVRFKQKAQTIKQRISAYAQWYRKRYGHMPSQRVLARGANCSRWTVRYHLKKSKKEE